MRVAATTWARALAAYALVFAVALGVLSLWVMTSESRHPAPLPLPSEPKNVEVAPPEDADIWPAEAPISDARTR